MSDYLDQLQAKRERDARRWLELDSDECMLCGAYGADKRSLFLDCGYAVSEVLPEILDIRALDPPLERGKAYYLLICKSCRGRLLGKIEEWGDECRRLRGEPKDHDGDLLERDTTRRNIPVRSHGAIEWLTQEEWDARNPGRQAVVLVDPPENVIDLTVLGLCVHGVDLDREFCPHGCRV